MEENRDLAQKYEKRIEGLILERGNVNSQLKQQLRTPPDARPTNGPKADDISLDPFDNKLDQVSESTVKSGVDSLNDSLDTFTMALLDEAEELAKHNSHSSLPSAIREHEKATKLLMALAKYSHVEEKRGFLLDAHLHHGLVVELDRLFFSGEVVCRVLDTQRVCAATLNKLTKQEPWTVAQRWRALTAAAVGTILNPSVTKNSITHYSESTVALLAWAYRQPLETFEPLIPKIQSQLASLYEEASKLSVIVRRDVLSVRMSVVVAPVDPKAANDYLPYNPDAVTSVWPDMKVVAGDEVIALYKFGLKKYNENRQIHRLIKPEVTTTALLREMAKI
ncbi:hypothetical protein B0H13DRAFT_1614390 [Mycena leptocephala]|nr:hypothetical protein B0H13DRAFT_1614390 [Mycena leptocephala]